MIALEICILFLNLINLMAIQRRVRIRVRQNVTKERCRSNHYAMTPNLTIVNFLMSYLHVLRQNC